MSETAVSIHLVPGDTAPRYEGNMESELELVDVIITEQGTKAHLPLIDLVMVCKRTGNRHFAVITGRIANMISSAVKGVNMRNHGNPEP